jgi:hypothetical protein
MSKRKNKGHGIRSKNARVKTARRKVPNPVVRVEPKPAQMFFSEVELGAPREGALLLVRLHDDTYRFGMCLKGRFANYEYHAEEFVTFAHAERITHWMEVIPPVPFSTAKAEAETPEAEGSSTAPSIEEAAMAAAAADDVYL